MIMRELIQAELARIPEEKLAELYHLIQYFTTAKATPSDSIMAKLQGIRIEASADFATNLDLYARSRVKG